MVQFVHTAGKGNEAAVSFPALAQMISGDAKEKSVEIAASRSEALGFADQGHENLLRYVFGDGRAAAHVQREAIDRGMLLAVEMREGIFVSRPHTPEQAIIR